MDFAMFILLGFVLGFIGAGIVGFFIQRSLFKGQDEKAKRLETIVLVLLAILLVMLIAWLAANVF